MNVHMITNWIVKREKEYNIISCRCYNALPLADVLICATLRNLDENKQWKKHII